MALFLRFKTAFFPQRNLNTHTAEQNCEMIVATAAPRTPICNPKINNGSRTIFNTAPIRIVNIPVFPNPWLLIKGFIPSVIITNSVPKR